jgi:hypothetical protein
MIRIHVRWLRRRRPKVAVGFSSFIDLGNDSGKKKRLEIVNKNPGLASLSGEGG